MPTPFADLELRVNASCLAHLVNAEATWTAAGGGASVDADVVLPTPIFEVTPAGTLGVYSHVRVGVATWPLAAAGDTVSIDGDTYRVRTVELERTGGLKRLTLAKV